jgi:BON domain
MHNSSCKAVFGIFVAFFAIAAQPPVHQRAPAAAAVPVRLTDAQIDAGIRLKLAKSKIAADKFHFKVQGGVVTIEGNTDVVQRKGAATRLAKTAGAVAVNNHIEISDAAKQKASDNLAKGRRRAQVKRGDARSSTPAPQTSAQIGRKSDSTSVQKR